VGNTQPICYTKAHESFLQTVFAIPFVILCLQPLVAIERNLLFCYSDKRWQFETKGVWNCTFVNRVSGVQIAPGAPIFKPKKVPLLTEAFTPDSHALEEDQAARLIESAGFSLETVKESGPYHYLIIARRA
jgi:hypothetical protein